MKDKEFAINKNLHLKGTELTEEGNLAGLSSSLHVLAFTLLLLISRVFQPQAFKSNKALSTIDMKERISNN